MLQHVRLLDWLTHQEIAIVALPTIPGVSFEHAEQRYAEQIHYSGSLYKIRAICKPVPAHIPHQLNADTIDIYVEAVATANQAAPLIASDYVTLKAGKKGKFTVKVMFKDTEYPWAFIAEKDYYATHRENGFAVPFTAVPQTGDIIRLSPPFPCNMQANASFFVYSVTHYPQSPNQYSAVITVYKTVWTREDIAPFRPIPVTELARLNQKIYEMPAELMPPATSATTPNHPAPLNPLVLTPETVSQARRASISNAIEQIENRNAQGRRASLLTGVNVDPLTRTLSFYSYQYAITDVRFGSAYQFALLFLHNDTYTIEIFNAKNSPLKKQFSYTNADRNAQILAYAFTPDNQQLVILERLATAAPTFYRLVWLDCSNDFFHLRRKPKQENLLLPPDFSLLDLVRYGDGTLHVEENLLIIGLACGEARGNYQSKMHQLFIYRNKILSQLAPIECSPHAQYQYDAQQDTLYGLDVHHRLNIWHQCSTAPQTVTLNVSGIINAACQMHRGILWACWTTSNDTIHYIQNPLGANYLAPSQTINITRSYFSNIRSLKICPVRHSVIFATNNTIAEYSLAHNKLQPLISWPSANEAHFTLSQDNQWCVTWSANLLQLRKLATRGCWEATV